VGALLILSAGSTGALAGLAAGVLWQLSSRPQLGMEALVVLGGAAVAADAVHLRSGRLRPLAFRRQVPRAWGRLFDARTAATLYGARLGVGPLTHLATWMWWPATLAAASNGIGPSLAVGSIFGVVRMVTVVLTSRHVEQAMPERIAALRKRERTVAPVLSLIALLGLVVGLS
jgi:hypothetical protein